MTSPPRPLIEKLSGGAMAEAREIPIRSTEEWESLPEWEGLSRLVEELLARNASRHPGIITEAVVDAITARYELLPRESWHRERRRNHPERIRRLSHSVFRILEASEGGAPVRQITAAVLKAFLITPRAGGEGG